MTRDEELRLFIHNDVYEHDGDCDNKYIMNQYIWLVKNNLGLVYDKSWSKVYRLYQEKLNAYFDRKYKERMEELWNEEIKL